jgi:hypothetical protein
MQVTMGKCRPQHNLWRNYFLSEKAIISRVSFAKNNLVQNNTHSSPFLLLNLKDDMLLSGVRVLEFGQLIAAPF